MRPLLPALLAGLLAAAPAFAQATPPAAAPATATPASAAPAMPAAGTAAKRDAAVERRIAELHSRLKITPAQERQFGDFAGVMRDNATRMSAVVQTHRDAAATGNAVDQMRHYAELAQAHSEDVQRLVPAFSTLYEALTPDQKKLADQSFRDFSQGKRGGGA